MTLLSRCNFGPQSVNIMFRKCCAMSLSSKGAVLGLNILPVVISGKIQRKKLRRMEWLKGIAQQSHWKYGSGHLCNMYLLRPDDIPNTREMKPDPVVHLDYDLVRSGTNELPRLRVRPWLRAMVGGCQRFGILMRSYRSLGPLTQNSRRRPACLLQFQAGHPSAPPRALAQSSYFL